MANEFIKAICEIEKEKNINRDILFDAIDAALWIISCAFMVIVLMFILSQYFGLIIV